MIVIRAPRGFGVFVSHLFVCCSFVRSFVPAARPNIDLNETHTHRGGERERER